MPTVLRILIALCALAPALLFAAEPDSRAEAVKIIADLDAIVTPNGVERLETVEIGGIEQWVSIRGDDLRNPVLLMIHGGPGHVSMPTAWYFQRGWEEYFTVVQWDQRGAGKTYATNDPAKVAPTMTYERMVKDAEAMVAWLREEFDKEKIFVLGHSWGSILGLEVALRRPEWLHAYIGMGQGVEFVENERRSYDFVLARAREDGNAEAIRELEAIAPYPSTPFSLEDFATERKWLNYYGGAVYQRTSFAFEAEAVKLSPAYTDEDIQKLWDAYAFSEKHLLDAVFEMDFTDVTRLECPLIVFAGRHDYNVSSTLAAEWFERVEAPFKQFVWFEHSGHEIMNEEPGKTLVSLVTHALPIAVKAGDAPPR